MDDPAASPSPERRRFSRIQVLEATAATIFAAAILGTAGGMGWLIISLPNKLQQLESQVNRIVQNQDIFGGKFDELQKQVIDHDRRIIRLEVR